MSALTLAAAGPRFTDLQLGSIPESETLAALPAAAASGLAQNLNEPIEQIPNSQSEGPNPAPKKRRKKSKTLRFPDSPARVKQLRQLLPQKIPRQRDLKIYEYVVFQQMSQYDVADLFGITQPRVCQIIEEVRAWKCTVPWEIPGMTEEQQINLATHETRRWLEVIREKAMKNLDASGQTLYGQKTVTEKGEVVQQVETSKPQSAKSGFLNIAMHAVIKAGQLGGAGKQWGYSPKSRVQSPESEEARSPESVVQSSESEAKGWEPGAASGRLLKENPPAFSPQNGKANRHKSSVVPESAQVKKRRPTKKRQNAYHAAANRAGVEGAGRFRFQQLLRRLDRLAERVELRVQKHLQDDGNRGIPPWPDWQVQQLRRNTLLELLDLNREVELYLPYGTGWIGEQYDAGRGVFRWQLAESSLPEAKNPPAVPPPGDPPEAE